MKTKSIPLFMGALVAILTCSSGALQAQSDFSFGSYHVYNVSGISIDTFKACGFNSIGVTLVDAVPSKNLGTLAANNLEVTAGLPILDHIGDAAANAELIHWQAEAEASIRMWIPDIDSNVVYTRVEHLKGGANGDAWTVDAPDTNGVAWQLSHHVQVTNTPYTALFYLRVGSLPEGDIARLRIYDINDPTESFTRTVTATDFSDTTSFHACCA